MKHVIIALLVLAMSGSSVALAGDADTLHFKGFSLGMSFDAAETLIKEKYAAIFGDCTHEATTDDMRLQMTMNNAPHMLWIDSLLGPIPVVRGDAQGQVAGLVFPAVIVDKLFNSEDMSPQAFMLEFAKAYDLPRLPGAKTIMDGATRALQAFISPSLTAKIWCSSLCPNLVNANSTS